MVHLGVQRPLGQRLLQIVQKAIRIKRRFRIGAGQQLVEEGIRNLRFFASRHIGAPSIPLCPTPHGIPDSPAEVEFTYALDADTSFALTAHAVYLPKPKLALQGPGGVQASFAWQAARDPTLGRMATATLRNDVPIYTNP
ncbi:hypothetical protein [uncultured Amaricoccus sp.]|uniref:hypothetical protein n=1 Tax=uncultured Amaricoccus sp. TaxID=339341 RepID=UPI00260DCE97|nr:hypothetical protein [uncultured Amaricoccus sp.]